MEELLQILNKLEENTNAILKKNKELEDEIKILKGETLNYLDCTNIGISSVDGAEINNSARLSTDYIATGNIKGKVKVNCTNDYYYLVRLYDKDKNYLGYPEGVWRQGEIIITSNKITSDVAYVRLVMKNKTGTDMQNVEGTVCINDGIEYTLSYKA